MTHEYYTEFNATLEAHGFEKLAEETINSLSKEAAYYDAFISTCLQQGMTKSAAVTLYKEANPSKLLKLLQIPVAIFKNTRDISKVKDAGKGLWTAVRHPLITRDAIKGSDAAIAAAKTTGGRIDAFRNGIKTTRGATTLNSKEKILNDIVSNRGKNTFAGGRAYKKQKLIDDMMLTRINNTPTMGKYFQSLGLAPEATKVNRLSRAKSLGKAPKATTADAASTASTASAAPKATAGSPAVEGTASKMPGATPQGTAEIKDMAAGSTTDAAALSATGTKETAALTTGIKNKLKSWGPYALAGGAGYLLGNHGSASAPITVAPTIVVPGAQGGAYLPGALKNGLMYGYG